MVDLEAWPGRRPRQGVPFIVDNTVATPYLCRAVRPRAPTSSVHSLTKFMGGHGTSIGGIVVDSGKFDWTAHADRFPGSPSPIPSYHGVVWSDALGPAAYIGRACGRCCCATLGAALSPFNAFLILQGVETLPLRIERHSSNAQAVAEHLPSTRR